MGLFGKKDDNKNKADISDIDAKILAAIDETDAEEEQLREEKRIAAQERASAPAEEKMSVVSAASKRAFLLSEGDSEAGDGRLTLTGKVHGPLLADDRVYILTPDGAEIPARVSDISGADGEGTLKNVLLIIDDGNDKDLKVPGFSAISTVKTQHKADPNRPMENPYLLALTLEYARFAKERDFMKIFLQAVLNAAYLLPVHDGGTDPDGKKKLKLITIRDKNDNSKVMLAAFTDLGALSAWKGVFDDEHKPTVTPMTFPVLAKSLKPGHELVINPFGPVQVKIPRAFIDSVLQATGGSGAAPKAARKIRITPPPENDETRSLRDAVRKYAESDPAVMSVGILLKADDSGKGYLFVVDCGEEAQKAVFDGLLSAVAPVIGKGKRVEFALLSKTEFAKKIYMTRTPDYLRKI